MMTRDNTVDGLWDRLEEIATALDAPREDLVVLPFDHAHRVLGATEFKRLKVIITEALEQPLPLLCLTPEQIVSMPRPGRA